MDLRTFAVDYRDHLEGVAGSLFTSLPAGPYSPEYRKDGEKEVEVRN